MIVQKINFKNPGTNKNQIGYLVAINNQTFIRTYRNTVYSNLSDKDIYAKFSKYNKSDNFIKSFFKL